MTGQPKKTLTRYAMEYGVYTGIYFVLMFVSIVWSQYIVVANLLGTAMMVSVPAIIYLTMRHYVRQEPMSGFGTLWLLGIYIFFFSSLISGLAQYLFFEYLDPAWIPSMLEQQLALLEVMSTDAPELGDFVDAARQGIERGVGFAPIDVVFTFMWFNVFIGSILSVIVAFFVRIISRIKQ